MKKIKVICKSELGSYFNLCRFEGESKSIYLSNGDLIKYHEQGYEIINPPRINYFRFAFVSIA